MSDQILSRFVDVSRLSETRCDSPIAVDLKYASEENFLGELVDGYEPEAREVGLLTCSAARSLCEAQAYFLKTGLSLLIFDAYRPLRAVAHFDRWRFETTETEIQERRRMIHFPHLKKSELAQQGYIPDTTVSRHCYGATVDLTLLDLNDSIRTPYVRKNLNGYLNELDMGAVFDFFDGTSHVHPDATKIGEIAWKNRELLRVGMERFGFQIYDKEFWHFDHSDREIEKPADFKIDASLKGWGV